MDIHMHGNPVYRCHSCLDLHFALKNLPYLFLIPKLIHDMANLCTNFEVLSFNPSRDILQDGNFKMGHVT